MRQHGPLNSTFAGAGDEGQQGKCVSHSSRRVTIRSLSRVPQKSVETKKNGTIRTHRSRRPSFFSTFSPPRCSQKNAPRCPGDESPPPSPATYAQRSHMLTSDSTPFSPAGRSEPHGPAFGGLVLPPDDCPLPPANGCAIRSASLTMRRGRSSLVGG